MNFLHGYGSVQVSTTDSQGCPILWCDHVHNSRSRSAAASPESGREGSSVAMGRSRSLGGTFQASTQTQPSAVVKPASAELVLPFGFWCKHVAKDCPRPICFAAFRLCEPKSSLAPGRMTDHIARKLNATFRKTKRPEPWLCFAPTRIFRCLWSKNCGGWVNKY